MNLYGYAAGDPVNYSDPFGLCVLWIKWCPPRDAHYARNKHNTHLPATRSAMLLAAIEEPAWQLQIPERSVYHRNGAGNGNNLKYVNMDDGREVIYNWMTGEMVTDPSNIGTFNFSPKGAGHFFKDVIPYWLWGNSAEDGTPAHNRILGADIQNTWEEVNRWLSDAQAAGVRVTVRH